MEREVRLSRAFVTLADTLVKDYEVLDFLYLLCDLCTEALEVDAVGVLLTGAEGTLQLCAASTEELRVLELFQLQQREGPCQDAYHDGEQVTEDDFSRAAARWPRFAPRAVRAGFTSVHAFPLRLRGERIGALNMFRAAAGVLDERDIEAGQALADVATVGITQERVLREADERARHLQHALDRRLVIEQAKGMLAERLDVDTGEAFNVLRRRARRENRTVVSVSQAVIEGRLEPE